MKTVLKIISGEIKNQKSRFVFPSETAASLWSQKICRFTGERSIALSRFLAWDRFKEEVVRSELQDKEPVSSVIRKLFTERLIRENARRPFFRALIPPEYAAEGRVFSASIAALLPSLGFWEKRLREAEAVGLADDEDQDLALLKAEYAQFLERENLFEPSWERPPLRDREHQYYIFFPEAMEDFTEYESLLCAEPSVHIVRLEAGDAPGELYRFDSAREEIRCAVLEIRRFHEEEGIPFEDMAVSLPGLAEAEPYLLRELSLYNIPARRRAGKPLAEFGTGKLFSLISACVSNNFSFASVKSLLLNEQLPWRFPQWNRELIGFGIQNNCVSPYRDHGRPVDIWLEAFRNSPREERLRRYYQSLKEDLTAMTSARGFSAIRRRYFAFRGGAWARDQPWDGGRFPGFLSRDACSPEGDAALARCIEELSALIQLEADYPDLVPASPFAFYLSILQEKQYVPQQERCGVNIFPYRVAAAAPFACHFVLNASQNAATVLYQPLKFLRQDKRKRLKVIDADASAAFFSLYWGCGAEDGGDPGGPRSLEFRSHLRISASERTFSGWAIPHSFFANPLDAPGESAPDPFRQEREWWADRDAAEFPSRIFPVQKEGFERWSGALAGQPRECYQLLKAPFPEPAPAAALLRERLRFIQMRRKEGAGEFIKVSATDLTAFFSCPASWLYRKVWGLAPFEPDAKLLDDASLGLLYHAILKTLFERIREADRFFTPANMEQYCCWAEEITRETARAYPAFQGPLAVPLLVSQSRAIARRLRLLLHAESEYFAGYAVADLEASLEFVRGEALLNGRIDRVSVSPEDVPVIVDYKTNAYPSKKDSGAVDGVIGDFQMPVYVRLYEEARKQQVGGAFFFSINKRDIGAVIGSPGGKRGQGREDYEPTLEALEGYIGRFCAALKDLNFAPEEISVGDCAGCVYKTVCRTAYSLNG
ncbi:MAG: PD-(D/E)XK nuclease family protein [Treponema sp.]|jgi:hypothetical protein|nr:PD-(D/E)XK nuclease family protein [Treponema sp.]